MGFDLQYNSTEKELFRMLELKLVPESRRTSMQQIELDKLRARHKSYALLTVNELMKKLYNAPKQIALFVQSPGNSIVMSADYERQFALRPGHPKPSQRTSMITLVFKTDLEAFDFLQSQAAKGRKFKVLNAQHRVLAISHGNGVILQADGRSLQASIRNNRQPVMPIPRTTIPTPFAMTPSMKPALVMRAFRDELRAFRDESLEKKRHVRASNTPTIM